MAAFGNETSPPFLLLSVPLESLGAGTTAGDVLTWNGTTWYSAAGGGGGGFIINPASANGVVRCDGGTGTLAKDSVITLDDVGVFSNLDSAATNNTALGNLSLQNAAGGGFNTGVGGNSLGNVTSGANNTAIGYGSGLTISTGTDNICIGAGTNLPAASVGLIAIGNATVEANSKQALGGGAAATNGTIGGTGPAVVGQNSWLKLRIGGGTYFIPLWQ